MCFIAILDDKLSNSVLLYVWIYLFSSKEDSKIELIKFCFELLNSMLFGYFFKIFVKKLLTSEKLLQYLTVFR